ncbi:MAG TPA: hypothetical protein VN222_14555 [Novosphingobium sp.]|nr:hypothetical protein [Novosphingobium sp.]
MLNIRALRRGAVLLLWVRVSVLMVYPLIFVVAGWRLAGMVAGGAKAISGKGCWARGLARAPA